MTDSTPDLTGLSRGQKEYFKTLEAMGPDPNLQRAIEAAKRELLSKAAAHGDEGTAEVSAPPALRNLGEESEVALQILLDQELGDGFYARVSDAVTGSESDRYGATPAETVASALSWANVEGFEAPAAATIDELRHALSSAADAADFELTVKLYTSF